MRTAKEIKQDEADARKALSLAESRRNAKRKREQEAELDREKALKSASKKVQIAGIYCHTYLIF